MPSRKNIKKVLQEVGKKLIQDLESTKEGQKDWRKYEFVTREILEFLFVDLPTTASPLLQWWV